jgi:hypothetical protein
MKARNRPLWIFGLLILVLTAGAAHAVAGEVIYLPLVVSESTWTPTPGPSLTPTPTQTPTPTPHPHAVIEIVRVVNSNTQNPLDEYVEIRNRAGSTYNLTGWFIRDENNYRYDFPDGFRLYGYYTIRVWSRDGVDTSYNLFWNSPVEIWNDYNDCAYLRDDSQGGNDLVSHYCYSSRLWDFGFR